MITYWYIMFWLNCPIYTTNCRWKKQRYAQNIHLYNQSWITEDATERKKLQPCYVCALPTPLTTPSISLHHTNTATGIIDSKPPHAARVLSSSLLGSATVSSVLGLAPPNMLISLNEYLPPLYLWFNSSLYWCSVLTQVSLKSHVWAHCGLSPLTHPTHNCRQRQPN